MKEHRVSDTIIFGLHPKGEKISASGLHQHASIPLTSIPHLSIRPDSFMPPRC